MTDNKTYTEIYRLWRKRMFDKHAEAPACPKCGQEPGLYLDLEGGEETSFAVCKCGRSCDAKLIISTLNQWEEKAYGTDRLRENLKALRKDDDMSKTELEAAVAGYNDKMREFLDDGDIIMGHLVDGIESCGEQLAMGATYEQLDLLGKTMSAMAMAWADVARTVLELGK